MSIFDWFKAGPAKEFGSSLAQTLMQAVPMDAKMSDKKFAQKAEAALIRLDRRVAEFKSKHPLNAYKKAQLGNAFMWELKDAGYQNAYVDRLTEWLLQRL